TGGSVIVLLLAIGTERRRIKGHQRRAAGLGTLNIFDGGMHTLHRAPFSGDQTNHGGALLHRLIMTVPRLPDRWVLLDICAIIPKYEISAGQDFLPAVNERR